MEGSAGVSKDLRDERCWREFKHGDWCNSIDVRDFIVRNVTPYTGDETFLVGSSAPHQGGLGEAATLFRRGEEKGRPRRRRENAVDRACAQSRLHRSRQRSDRRFADRSAVQAGDLSVRRPAHGRVWTEGGRASRLIRRSTRPSPNTARATTTACSTPIRPRS